MKKKRRDWNGMIIKVCFAAFLLVYLGILCMRGYAKDVSIGAMHKEFESAKLLDGMDEGKEDRKSVV